MTKYVKQNEGKVQQADMIKDIMKNTNFYNLNLTEIWFKHTKLDVKQAKKKFKMIQQIL